MRLTRYLPQDMFEVTSCYYPITFTPPPDDPFGVTRDDLRDALKYALVEAGSDHPNCLPVHVSHLLSLRCLCDGGCVATNRSHIAFPVVLVPSECLKATPAFGPFCMPLLLEKMEAAQRDTRVCRACASLPLC